jgi:predicted regulator of Ras-like GTPase activity (Roadblock/LC7/MglB family)
MQDPIPLRRMVFSETAFHKIALLLNELLKRTQARLAVFADMNGYPVVHRGDIKPQSLSTLTALAAGSFAASSEMARMVNQEARFRYIYQEGGPYNVYIGSLGDDYFLMILFEKQVPLGLIRVLTQHILARINSLLQEVRHSTTEARTFLDSEFRDRLSRQLDEKLRAR